MAAAIVLVAKLPVAGKSKTRLGKRIGPEEAAHFSRASIQDLTMRLGTDRSRGLVALLSSPCVWLAVAWLAAGVLLDLMAIGCVGVGGIAAWRWHARSPNVERRGTMHDGDCGTLTCPACFPCRFLLYAPGTQEARDEFTTLIGDAASSWTLRPMASAPGGVTSSDLTLVLSEALADLQAQGFGPVIFIGSDCPDLPSAEIEQALTVCRDPRCAFLCAAEDGGYVLLGVPAGAPPAVFSGVHWSASDTAASQARILESHGLRVVMGGRYNDVDEVEDLMALRERLDAMPAARSDALCRQVVAWLERSGAGRAQQTPRQ